MARPFRCTDNIRTPHDASDNTVVSSGLVAAPGVICPRFRIQSGLYPAGRDHSL